MLTIPALMLTSVARINPAQRGKEQGMADILTFVSRASQKPRGPYDPPGEVVIFPGIVIERLDAATDGAPLAPEAAAR